MFLKTKRITKKSGKEKESVDGKFQLIADSQKFENKQSILALKEYYSHGMISDTL